VCGVGGIYLPGTQIIHGEHEQILSRLNEAMELRGPDASGVKISERVGLVHRRLSIIDLNERSNQPVESEDWILSYNGEIYNFKDIRKELSDKYKFETTCDTEVLLLALQEWGIEGALGKCAGMFAFLAYNKREEVLYAARDRMGIKPLLMTRLDDGGYCFASSVGALVSSIPDRAWERDNSALGSFFSLGAPYTTAGVFKGIHRVEPAHYIRCTPDGNYDTHRYWEPQYRPDFTMDDLASVVREHQVADVDVALFMSGGVDSTFLATVSEDLDCFHLISPETAYAEAVAERFGRKFVQVAPNLEQYYRYQVHVTRMHGEPLMSCGIPYVVSKEVRDHGYTVAISANGADELFHGYPRTPMPEYTPKNLPLHETKTYRWINQQVAHIFRDNRNFTMPEFEKHIPSLASVIGNLIEQCHLPNFPPSASHRWLELMTYVLHDLNATLDASSMANSVEVRVPFLDHRIVEGVLSWEANKLVTPKYGRKSPLKEYLSDYFPMSFFNRPKLGFSIHTDSLGPITKMSEHALARYKKNRSFRVNKKEKYGEYERDMIYLGSCCQVHEIWDEFANEQTGVRS